MAKVNLLELGATLGYKNESTVIRYFVKKFNEEFGLDENNVIATTKELIMFSMKFSKEELKEWAIEQLNNLVENEEVERQAYQPKEKAPKETKTKPAKTTKTSKKEEKKVEVDSQIKELLEKVKKETEEKQANKQ